MSRFLATGALLLTVAATSGALADEPKVRMETSVGAITIELFPDKAPATVTNFLRYVDEGFYNGTVFHRVIPGFMIQGGGYTPQMQEKATHAPIKNEADNGLKNDRGSIAMARTSDPNSATAQFFINLKDNDFLNHTGKSTRGWGYAVFGKVISGMDVVDKIAAVTTGAHPKGLRDVPKTPVVIEKVTRVGSAGAAK
jgi:peptidyl-prolyl cis-trans isomerase A (cyclophilin A)